MRQKVDPLKPIKRRKTPSSKAIRILDKCFYPNKSIHAKSILWAAKMHLEDQQKGEEV